MSFDPGTLCFREPIGAAQKIDKVEQSCHIGITGSKARYLVLGLLRTF